jgi:hypothetical protein
VDLPTGDFPDLGARRYLRDLCFRNSYAVSASPPARPTLLDHTDQRIPDSTISEILEYREKRLNDAREGQLLPRIAYTPVQFIVTRASEWASQWGQAASLLQAIAEFPRKVVADRLFLRGVDVDESEMLEAMDVCSDAVLKVSNRRDSKIRAIEDLQVLARLVRSQADARGRCELILRLIGGAKAEEIGAEIPDGHGVAANTLA